MNKNIKLRLPFNGKFPITFPFGAPPDSKEITDKYKAWGLIGHNGIDFGLPEGAKVLACDGGEVIASGENGDFGISVTLEHIWGISLYGHLEKAVALVGEKAQAGSVLGFSGKTGFAFGAHLHFGIKPKNEDSNNGYGGFIDPSPYLVVQY